MSRPIDVNLYDVIVPFGGVSASRECVEPLCDWIDRGSVVLSAVSLLRFLSVGWELEVERLLPRCSGRSAEHRRLCAISALFLSVRGKRSVIVSGPSNQGRYSAGVADVLAEDRSVFVECGTVRENKIVLAMRAMETVMVVPYGHEDDVLGFLFKPTSRAPKRDVFQNNATRGIANRR
jgi:hypothetical protein